MRPDPLLVVALAAMLGGLFPAAPVEVLVASSALGALLVPHVGLRGLALPALALTVTLARAGSAVPEYESELRALRSLLPAPRRCSARAEVLSSPVLRDGKARWDARLAELDCEGLALAPLDARLHGGPLDVARGDRLDVIVDLAAIERHRNLGLGDPLPSLARGGVTASGGVQDAVLVAPGRGLLAAIDHARGRARDRIQRTFPPLAAPLARALVLGENDLPETDDEAFRRSGLAHLLAVSGTHLVFAVLGVVRAIRALLARFERLATHLEVGRLAAALGAILSPLYADFAGGSGSARRAGVMLCAGLALRAAGRHPSAARALAASIALAVARDPLVGLDVSFLLSAGATIGLLSLGPGLTAALAPEGAGRLRRLVLGSVATTLAAMLPCAPLLALLGPTLTVAGILANVLAVPFGETVSLPLCLVHTLAGWEPLARGIALVASGALLVVRALALASAAASFAAVPVPPPGPGALVVLGVGAVGVALATDRLRRRGYALAGLAALVVTELAALRAGRPLGALRASVLDVGQGDATLIDLPDGTLMLVDGGGSVGGASDPGAAVVLPLLRARRRARIDVAILSHPHPDHYLGLATVLARVDVGELWDTGQGAAQGAGPEYHAMLRDLAARGVPVRHPEELCRGPFALGGARVTVLAPCPGFDPALGANDNSLVVKLTHGRRSLLLVGDAEAEAERRLVARDGGALRSTWLKVGHHGSRTSSSPAFLAAVGAEIATISAGTRNRFGHPHRAALEALAAAGAVTLRTDRAGSLELWTDGEAARASTFGETLAARVAAALDRLPRYARAP